MGVCVKSSRRPLIARCFFSSSPSFFFLKEQKSINPKFLEPGPSRRNAWLYMGDIHAARPEDLLGDERWAVGGSPNVPVDGCGYLLANSQQEVTGKVEQKPRCCPLRSPNLVYLTVVVFSL